MHFEAMIKFNDFSMYYVDLVFKYLNAIELLMIYNKYFSF